LKLFSRRSFGYFYCIIGFSKNFITADDFKFVGITAGLGESDFKVAGEISDCKAAFGPNQARPFTSKVRGRKLSPSW
jgi:hypothetical protein